MIIQFTPFIILLLLSGIVSAGLTVIGWNNRALPIAKPFILLMAAETIWIFGSAFEMMSTQLGTVLFFNNIEYPAMMTASVAWLLIALCHTGREHYLTKKTVPLLFIVPALVCLLVITNPLHHLYYSGFHEETIGGAVVWIYEHGPFFWIMIAYNYVVGFVALILAASRLFSSNDFYRRQTLLIICAACIPVFFNLAYIFHLNPFPEYDLTPIGFLLTGIVLAIGLLGYQLFSAVPVAYSRVFATIHDGVFVINSQFRVIDLNPAAELIVRMRSTQAVGRKLTTLVPPVATLLEHPVPAHEKWQGELLLTQDDQPRYFDVILTPMDEKGIGSSGYLCIFRDVTARKHAELSLMTANRKINLLTRITRHDLENKLMIVHGYIALLRKSPLAPAQKEYLDKQEAAVNVMRDHIAFTRKYQQLGAQAPAWQHAETVFRRAKTQVFLDRVRFSCNVGAVEILADAMLERVFYNLLDNAMKYGGDRMTGITITSHEDGAFLVIVVEDDGEGISERDTKRLFEQGFGKNTGLGLFLSREILAITDITIEYTGVPGSGGRFEIRVPPGKFRLAAR
ncbi:MAG: ATP-binding protein [Methanoregula sp.]|nr:ATP-binding protein [Methanoregula sp.]